MSWYILKFAWSMLKIVKKVNSSFCIKYTLVGHVILWIRIGKPDELQQLKGIVRTALTVPDSEDCNVLMVMKQGGFVLTSATSCYSKSNLIFANRQSVAICLAQVMYCQIDSAEPRVKIIWVIAVKWHMDHPCKVWYGYPSQVWSCVQCSELDSYPSQVFNPEPYSPKQLQTLGDTMDVLQWL